MKIGIVSFPHNSAHSQLNKNQFCQCQNATFCSKVTVIRKQVHTESEIIKSVNELKTGVSADEICRRLNVSRATLYQWKRKYGGLEVSQLKKLKELEEENAKPKKMYANLALDNEILREVIEKKI